MNEDLISKALKIALEEHKTQRRKIKDMPFVIHPISVGNILIGEDATSEIIAAGFLHDCVEDTRYTLGDVENDFNLEVRKLVEFATEDMNLSWIERKNLMIDKCKTCDEDFLLLEFADKLSNLESLYFEVEEFGPEILTKFSGSLEEIKDYYFQIYNILLERLPNLKQLEKYDIIYNNLFS